MDVDNVATARRISTAAFDDTDALMLASKRHDQQLLDDINAKLANASFSQPVTVKRSTTTTTQYSSPRPRDRPPLPTTLRSRYLLHAAVDDDVDEALVKMPPTPVTRSVIRSSSVPPRLPRMPARGAHHVTRTDSHVTPLHHHGVPVYEKVVYDSGVTNHPSYWVSSSAHLSADVPTSPSLTPVADLAVRQAHRNLDRIDKEINLTYAPDGPHKFSSKTYVAAVQPVGVVRRSSVRVPSSTYGGGGSVMVTRRTSSMSPSRAGGGVQLLRYRPPSPSPAPSDLLLLASSVSPPPPVVLPVTPVSRVHVSAPSVAELQHQMKVDLLKTTAMDADLPPLHTGVYKQRIEPVLPYSTYVAPRSAHVTAHVIATPPIVLPPAPPVHVQATTDYAPLPQPISVRPKVSETRRKVRDVLCKIKKDPHYFD